jgi:hypothetical protein
MEVRVGTATQYGELEKCIISFSSKSGDGTLQYSRNKSSPFLSCFILYYLRQEGICNFMSNRDCVHLRHFSLLCICVTREPTI